MYISSVSVGIGCETRIGTTEGKRFLRNRGSEGTEHKAERRLLGMREYKERKEVLEG